MAENVHRVILTAADKTRAAFSSFRKNIKEATDSTNSLHSASSTLRSGLGALGIGLSAGAIFTKVISETSQFETALIGVAKTTGLAGSDLDDFAERINGISREIPVTTAELLELSQAAGQMGVTGSANLEKFAVTVAKLGRASDISGEQAATALARILNVTKEGVDSVDTLASVIVALGAKVAASESQITRMTTEVARATSQFGVSSAEAAAMSAAMASIGIQAELGGSAVGRTMQEITSRVQAGGKELQEFADVLNLNSQTLVDLFAENKTEAFLFLLREIGELGLDAGNALEEVGLGGQEIAKTIIPFANNVERLEETLRLANEEVKNATALDREFEAALVTLGSQWQITKNITESYARSLGSVLLPSLNDALVAVNETANEFHQLAVNGEFSQWSDNTARQFAFVGDSARSVVSVFNILGLSIGAVAAQAAAFSTFDFEGVDAIQEAFKLDVEQEILGMSKLRDAVEAHIIQRDLLTDAVTGTSNALDEESDVIKPLIKPIRDLGESYSKTGKESDKLAKQKLEFVGALSNEIERVGKNAFEIRKLDAANLGLLESTEPLIDQLEEKNRLFEEEQEAARKVADDLAKVESITQSVATAEEKLAEEQAELNRLMGIEGGLSAETYGRALDALQDDFEKTRNTSKGVFGDIDQFSTQAFRNMQTQLARTISEMEFDLKGFVSIGKRLFGELAAASILRGGASLLSGGTFGSGFAGTGGATGSNALSIAGIGSSLTNGFSSIRSLLTGSPSVFSAGSGGAGTAFIGGQGTAIGGTGFGASAGSGLTLASGGLVLGGALLTSEFNRLIANDNKISGVSSKTLNTIINPLSQIPVIGKFLPDLGGVLTGIFGRGQLKQKETNLIGDINAEGFQGVTSVKFKANGGLVRGSKVDRVINDTRSGELLNGFRGIKESGISGALSEVAEEASKAAIQLGRFLDDNVKGFSTSLRDAAGVLGLGVDAIDNFSSSINIASEKGKSLSEAQIAEELAKVSNEMATGLIPAIGELGENGEKAFDTVIRLAAETQALTNVLAILGDTSDQAKSKVLGIDFDGRSGIVDQFGGLDALNSQFQFFFDNALSGSQQLEFFTRNLGDSLTKAGFAADLSVEDFNNLILTMNDVGGIGLEAASKLLPLGAALYQVRDAAELLSQAEQSRNLSLIDVFATDAEKTALLKGKVDEGLAGLGLSADTTFEQLNQLARAQYSASDGANEFLDKLAQFLPAFLQLNEAVDQQDIKPVNDAFGALQTSVDTERNRLTNDYNESIKQVNQSIGTLTTLSDALKSTTEAINPLDLDQARNNLRGAIAQASSGNIVDLNSVRTSLAVLSKNDTSAFRTREEFVLSQEENTSLLDQLGGITDDQLSAQEQSLEALQIGFDSEIGRLDAMLVEAQNQVSLLQGIDSSIQSLGVGGSLADFNTLSVAAGGNAIAGAGGSLPFNGNRNITGTQIEDFLAVNDDPFTIYNAARDNNVTGQQLAANSRFTIDQINQFADENNLPRLAIGTNFIPRDMPAFLHKGEEVKPRAFVDKESAERRQTVQLLSKVLTATEVSTVSNNKVKKTLDKWEKLGMPKERAA